jgi:fructose-1,6-bisphosphatase/sedoheptulose 1,7-bisphosphatase-like protein
MLMTKGRYTGGSPPLEKGQKGPSPVLTVRVQQSVRNDLEKVSKALGREWRDIVRAAIAREVARLKRLIEKRGGK